MLICPLVLKVLIVLRCSPDGVAGHIPQDRETLQQRAEVRRNKMIEPHI